MLAGRRRRRAAAAAAAASLSHRVDRPAPASAPPALQAAAAALRAPPTPPPNTLPVRVAWRCQAERPPVVAASFDGWLHHRLSPVEHEASHSQSSAAGQETGDVSDVFSTVLYFPIGTEVSYKFLVDGKWRVDDIETPPPAHPLASDGKVHIVPPQFRPSQTPAPSVTAPQTSIPSTVSCSDIPLRGPPSRPQNNPPLASPNPSLLPRNASFPRKVSGTGNPLFGSRLAREQDRSVLTAKRTRTAGAVGSANAEPVPEKPSSGYAAAARRSVMMRVGGARWRSKLGINPDGTHASAYDSANNSPFHLRQSPIPDRAPGDPSLAGRSGDIAEHVPPPVVGSASFFSGSGEEKENAQTMQIPKASSRGLSRDQSKPRPGGGAGILRNSFRSGNSGSLPVTPLRGLGLSGDKHASVGRSAARTSNRNLQKVVVSGPTRVDEPEDASQVQRTARNWRGMAQHLEDDLNDPVGARQLLRQAIEHLEKHGLWATLENAQAHIDLARAQSKAGTLTETEFHLRVALRIYEHVGAAAEHKGDLVHYIAVVVDRQKKRAEAEQLYRQALDVYKSASLRGENVKIALKNLSLNLKKQNRAGEAEPFVKDYLAFDSENAVHGETAVC